MTFKKAATCVTCELFLYGVCSWDSVVKCEGTLEGTRVLGMWGRMPVLVLPDNSVIISGSYLTYSVL